MEVILILVGGYVVIAITLAVRRYIKYRYNNYIEKKKYLNILSSLEERANNVHLSDVKTSVHNIEGLYLGVMQEVEEVRRSIESAEVKHSRSMKSMCDKYKKGWEGKECD